MDCNALIVVELGVTGIAVGHLSACRVTYLMSTVKIHLEV